MLYDRSTGETTSVPINGSAEVESARSLRISGAGRYLAFVSFDAGLVPGDTNNLADAFLIDRETGVTERVSLTSNGAQSTSAFDDGVVDIALSDDGRFVAFTTSADDVVSGDTNQNSDVFVRDRQTQRTTRESVGSKGVQIGWASRNVSISGDGRVVAFVTDGMPFVDPSKASEQSVFVVRDREADVTTVTQINSVSAAALAAAGEN